MSFAVFNAVALATFSISSITLRSRMSGTKPAPMPWMGWGVCWPPDKTGLASGSTATIFSPGRRGFSAWPTPVMVPPVPTPATKMSSLPAVSRQISSAVVRTCTSGFAGFWNCCGMKLSGTSFRSSSARAIEPFMPFSRGVSSRRAPRKRSILRRSIDIELGMVKIIL